MAKRSPGKKAPLAFTTQWAKVGKAATGSDKPAVSLRLIQQAVDSLWMPGGLNREEQVTRAQSAIELLKGLKPTDEIEGMLATQMVGTHSAAMECLRRAMKPDPAFAGFEQNLKHAAKLMSIYARQMDALNKHRGKGQQKVTVEHVHVEAGGQAVVGHVATAPNSYEQSKGAPKTITHAANKTLELDSQTRVPAKQRNK